jgi:hypothetical protein
MNNPSGPVFELPTNLDPPLDLCVQLTIPNDAQYYQQLWSLINIATYWFAWDRDEAHSGRVVANTWKRIIQTLTVCSNGPVPPVGGLIEDFEMPLRVDCDCNVFITCCDGTEKQLLTADQVRKLLIGQPGNGAPQPPPNGGCVTYDATIPAQGGYLVPTVVNSGDDITILNPDGAWYGGSVWWYCPDGERFFAGSCTGTQDFSGSSQIPAAPIGRIIAKIGTAYYDVEPTTFTVPAGHTNDQVTLLINTDTPSTAAGQVICKVQVCNNQAGSWTSTLDFRVNSFASILTVTPGHWVPGTGYEGDPSGGDNFVAVLQCALSTSHIKSWDVLYDGGGGAGAHDEIVLATTAGAYGTPIAVGTGTDLHYHVDQDAAGVTNIANSFNNGSGATGFVIKQWVITGVGTKPSQLP